MSAQSTIFRQISQIPDRYKRVVSGGLYDAKLDGIRFLAVISVVLCHISNHTDIYGGFRDSVSFVRANFIYNLFQGISLLFVLSSYLLSSYLFRNSIREKIKSYYYRRFIRIFPPYAIVLTICFVVLVFILNKIDVENGWEHYLASLFFANNFVYPFTHPIIMPIGWTIELEIQFYCILPLFLWVYKKNMALGRGITLFSLLLLPPLLGSFDWYEHTFLVFQIPYFMAGVLLADLSLNYKKRKQIPRWISGTIGSLCLLTLFLLNWYYVELKGVKIDLAPLLILIALYLMIHHNFLSKLLCQKWFCFIGNMGYSVYLIHILVISFLGKFTLHIRIGDEFLPNFILQCFLLIPAILIVSTIFYRLVEYPLMQKGKA